MNSSPLLKTEKLSVSIAGKKICNELDIEINKGECWAILGQNGTGKTTLLHSFAGLHYADSGEIFLNGKPVTQLTAREVAQQCGLLLQDYQDIFPATVMEAVLIGRHPHLTAWQWESEKDKSIAQSSLTDVGLSELSQRDIQTLSGGERQRTGIATILTQQPELFLLDEPTNHLDIKHQHQVLKLFSEKARQQNKAIVMVLHDVNLAARYCDHALLMYDNRIELGTTKEMLNNERLTELYGHPIRQIETEDMLFMPS